ncbi:MAG: hypothetical protein F4X44_07180 [Gammaproteobacteria bacterium]|nr:hypothetical protein [Gammaproteobacteria bacterium]MYD80378.1 hypothetical protein [Gammaproteobacteria bacterium]
MKSPNRRHYVISSTAIALLICSQVVLTNPLTTENEEAGVTTVAQIVGALSPQTPTTAQSEKPDTQPDVPTMDRLSSDSTHQTALRGFETWLKDNIKAHFDKTKRIHGSQATLGDTVQLAKRVLQAYRDHVVKCEKDKGRWDESEHLCRVVDQVTLSFRNIEGTVRRGYTNWLEDNISGIREKTYSIHGPDATLNDAQQVASQVHETYWDHVDKCTNEYGTWDESTHECWVGGRLDFSFKED